MICNGLVDWLIRYPMTAVVTVVFTSCPTRGGQQRNQFKFKSDIFGRRDFTNRAILERYEINRATFKYYVTKQATRSIARLVQLASDLIECLTIIIIIITLSLLVEVVLVLAVKVVVVTYTVDSRYLDLGYLEQPLISKRKSDPCFSIEI